MAKYSGKRRYLVIVFLNFVLDDVTLVPTTRKPFDVLAEGLLVSSSRGDRTAMELIPPPLRFCSRPLSIDAKELAKSIVDVNATD